MNQECIAITKCPFTKQLNMLIKYSSNEDEKKALQQIINSMICGGALSETVCCDIAEGINSIFRRYA